MSNSLIYLACPYTHPDEMVMLERFDLANRAANKLINLGLYVFSPISHTHPIRIAGSLPPSWEFWKGYDTTMIARCQKMIVVKAKGWEESKGVQAEIVIAKQLGIDVEYLEVE